MLARSHWRHCGWTSLHCRLQPYVPTLCSGCIGMTIVRDSVGKRAHRTLACRSLHWIQPSRDFLCPLRFLTRFVMTVVLCCGKVALRVYEPPYRYGGGVQGLERYKFRLSVPRSCRIDTVIVGSLAHAYRTRQTEIA